MEIQPFADYTATVRIRRDARFGEVRPEADALDGKRVEVSAGWLIQPEDRPAYQGEWAMMTRPDVFPVWIASGDLDDLIRI